MVDKLIIYAVLMFSISCRSNKNPTNQIADETSISSQQEQPQSLPPESCRIRGRIISIKKVVGHTETNNLCDLYPCDAVISIEKVLGYGSSFSTILYPEDFINLHFSLTLSDTKQAFPDKNVLELPGLKVGDIFEANIEGNLLDKKKFTTNQYKPYK